LSARERGGHGGCRRSSEREEDAGAKVTCGRDKLGVGLE
jgi:hypothetical protein